MPRQIVERVEHVAALVETTLLQKPKENRFESFFFLPSGNGPATHMNDFFAWGC